MRAIDADELLNNTDGLEHVKWSQEYGHVVLVCDIVYAPTLDVVEVVRCKDCKWHECYIRSRLIDGSEYKSDECRKFNMAVTPEWFCADGEETEDIMCYPQVDGITPTVVAERKETEDDKSRMDK